ncbi:MAG: hypothetical protein VKJ85_00470 [Prochlorothrix sp.]|nr:hypothetical protein [Prochlorothrix sp.]
MRNVPYTAGVASPQAKQPSVPDTTARYCNYLARAPYFKRSRCLSNLSRSTR